MRQNKLITKLSYLGIMLSMAFMLVMANPITVLAAEEGLFTKAENTLVNLYKTILIITTPLAALVTLILLVVMMVSDDKESASYKKWIKKIWIIWVIINCLGSIISWGSSFFADMGYDGSQGKLGATKTTEIQTIVNFLK